MNLTEFSKEVHQNAVNHGWWETEPTFGEIIALCHSELSEALQDYRAWADLDRVYYDLSGCGDRTLEKCADCYQSHIKCAKAKPYGPAVELADCILRILDICGRYDIDIETVLMKKHEHNKTRSYRHGEKRL